MKNLLISLIIILPICLGITVKKTELSGTAVTSIIYFHLNTEDIADTDNDFVGCRGPGTTVLAQVQSDICKIPAGVQKRILQFGAYIPVIEGGTAIAECDVSIAADGADIAATTISLGGSDMDEEGESVVNVLASPAWYPSGTELTFTVADNSDACEDGIADLARVTLWAQIETELE